MTEETLEGPPKDNDNGDEQENGAALQDPAILAVSLARLRYEKEEILKMRCLPLSQKRPDVLDSFPSISHVDRKKTTMENGQNNGDNAIAGGKNNAGEFGDHRKRGSGDPRERLRKENDGGIVLSPQRRSFNAGCFVAVRPNRNNPNGPSGGATGRTHSPSGGGGAGAGGGSNKNDGGASNPLGGNNNNNTNRRIGSGRILRDSWDFTEKPPSSSLDLDEGGDYSFRPHTGQNQNHHHHHSGRNEEGKRGFGGRDYDNGKDKERRGTTGRYNDRRGGRANSQYSRDEEPEWFSEGPTSQNDTIELRGFEDHERPHQKKKPTTANEKISSSVQQQKRGGGDWLNNNNANTKKKSETHQSVNHADERPQEGVGSNGDVGVDRNNEKDGEKTEKTNTEVGAGGDDNSRKTNDGQSFNFEDIFKVDSIPGLLTNGVGGEGDAPSGGKSRFSKWFTRPDSSASTNSASAQSINRTTGQNTEDGNLLSNFLMKDIAGKEPRVSIPPDSDSYFAPISPAAASTTSGGAAQGKSVNIMDMLQRGANKGNDFGNKAQVPGRIMNLDELESKIRRSGEGAAAATNMHKPVQQKTDEDVTAFNRILAHISGNNSNPAVHKPQPPMSLMEMLSHSQQQDEAQARMAHILGGGAVGPHPHMAQQQELAARLQQQQKQQQQLDMLSKLMNVGLQVHRASPLIPEMGPQQSRELLNRPEAQAILQGLKVGDITPQHLYQQLANPALQPRHRDMLVTILKSLQNNEAPVTVTNSPRVLSPVAPVNIIHQQQQQQQQAQQQLRVSPLPPNAYCVSPIMATSPNTLTVPPAIHQRIPSPRELQLHTQNILQRALIKKKLEEQQENYRKKQEIQQTRGQSPNNNNNNNNGPQSSGNTAPTTSAATTPQPKSVTSPTPLTFTPTSVLRKMTAEKDDKDLSKLAEAGGKGRAVTGMRQPQPQQQQWPQQYQMNMKQAGRPIVKANNFATQQQQLEFFAQHQQQQQKFMLQQQQQQLMRKQQQQQQFHAGHHQQQQQFSQQLRAQHQQQQHVNRQPTQPPQPVLQGQQQSQSQFGSWQQFFNTQGGRPAGRSGQTDGDLSPTSNQLTRWFSPDLLERARGGELPSTANLSQNLMSLEEIERLTAPPVHN